MVSSAVQKKKKEKERLVDVEVPAGRDKPNWLYHNSSVKNTVKTQTSFLKT